LRTKGGFGVRQLAAAFANYPVFKHAAKSASKLPHSESFVRINYSTSFRRVEQFD